MNKWSTTDLNIAAFLQEQGIELIGADQKDGKTTLYFNNRGQAAEKGMLDFYNGVLVNAVRYTDRLRHLKTLVMRGIPKPARP